MSGARFGVPATLLGVLVLGAGCRQPGSDFPGIPPEAVPVDVATALSTRAGAMVSVQGVMIGKCPVAGCWFILQDATGTLKVDTKSAGFVVVDVPLNTPITVSGRVLRDSPETALAATGLRY